MCIVTYLPSLDGFTLTSNRDEHLSRAETIEPVAYPVGDEKHYYPQDPESLGSWIAASDTGLNLCLLNGAFEKHISIPPYRKSRGLILLEILAFGGPEKFLRENSLEGVEPFTLIAISNNENLELRELRWDGERPYLSNLDPHLPYIWSSSTLYNPEARRMKEEWFRIWLDKNPEPGQDEILSFHQRSVKEDYGKTMRLHPSNDPQTLSITTVRQSEGKRSMHHHDLIKSSESVIELA
jgi:hypothetical protein